MVAGDRVPLCGACVADVRLSRKKGTCQLLRVILPAGMRGTHRGLRKLVAVKDAAKPTLRETEAPAVVVVPPGARQGVPATMAAYRRCPMRPCCGIERDGQGLPPLLFRLTLQDGMVTQRHLCVAACGRGRHLITVVAWRGRTRDSYETPSSTIKNCPNLAHRRHIYLVS